MSSIALHVALLSGEQIAISRSPHSTIGALIEVVQKEFQKPVGKLISASGDRLLESATLAQAGIRENDVVTAVVQDVAVAATSAAFAAIRANGTVVAWGCPKRGGDCSAVQDQLQNVQRLQATDHAFAAILGDGSVVSWGEPSFGGNSSAIQRELHGVCQIQATETAFAAIREDGAVVTWGDAFCGGDCSAVRDQLHSVQHIQSNPSAFAALRADGRVVTWGAFFLGGDSNHVCDELQDVLQVCGGLCGFAAIKAGGRIVFWGPMSYQGVHETGLDGITQVQFNVRHWAAATQEGHLALSLRLCDQPDLRVPSGVLSVPDCAASLAWGGLHDIIILQKDGMVQFWGEGVPEWLRKELTSVVRLRCGSNELPKCAAVRSDGSVVAWQFSDKGAIFDVSAHEHKQLQNVTDVQSTYGGAFAALRGDGTVVTWGRAISGGDSAAVQGQLRGVVAIQATWWAFAAIRSDGSVVSWGCPGHGGDSSRVRDQLGQATVDQETTPKPRAGKPKVKSVLKKPSRK
ncbi:USP [Symbiodinium natans]|uniref:USP protein n=1 Tax=Symbiodinium natans TaxID=878477 RepID=A0A812J4U3_9DINO|nr:USP [Symbiodinium natans]